MAEQPHPLPGQINVCDIWITPDPEKSSRSRSVSMDSYRRLSNGLLGSEVVPGPPRAAKRAVLRIETAEGDVREVVFSQDGLITSGGKTFQASNKARLFKTLAEISRKSEW